MSGRKPRNLYTNPKFFDDTMEYNTGSDKNQKPVQENPVYRSNDLRKSEQTCDAVCKMCCDLCGEF